VLLNLPTNEQRSLTIIDGGMDQTFPPMRSHAPSSGPPAFSHAISSSPALYQSRPAAPPARRPDGPPVTSAESSYSSGFPRISSPYGATPASDYSMASSQTIPSISGLTQGPLTSPPLAHHSSGMMGQFNQSIPRYVKRREVIKYNMLTTPRSQNLYDGGMYSQPMGSGPPGSQLYTSSRSPSYPSPTFGAGAGEMMPKPSGSSDAAMRVLNQRPKPQCWEHGCNGRQFSTFSNLLRHQREKSGTASKSYCPRCNAEFTRTTARNGHLAHDKCTKTRRDSEEQ
jgi:hypothetical protein